MSKSTALKKPVEKIAESKTRLTTTKEVITPELAEKYLEKNVHNRPITQSKVAQYAADMKEGRWDLNGETIIFDWNGTLQDGQHRLWACFESESSFETMVVRGVDPSTFKTVDTGRARTAGDVIGIEKIPYRNSIAAAIGMIIRYKRGTIRTGSRVSNADVLEFLRVQPTIVDWAQKIKQSKGGQSSVLLAVAFLAARNHPEKAQEFITQFQTGANLIPGSPVLTVRNRLLSEPSLKGYEKMELIIRAWNAFIEGRKLTKAVIGETFPFVTGA